MRLWDKGGDVDAAMMRFTARDDWSLDRAQLAFDRRATRADVLGLARIGVMSALDETRVALSLLPRVVAGAHFDEARMAAAIDAPCFATDRAVTLAVEGVPFRTRPRRS